MHCPWIPGLKGMLLVTNSPSGEVISYFVENSSGCPFNYLDEILFNDKRFQTNHFYILIGLKRKIVFVKIRFSITSSSGFLPGFTNFSALNDLERPWNSRLEWPQMTSSHLDIKMRQVANQRLRLENQRLKAEMARKMNEMVSHADSTRNQGRTLGFFEPTAFFTLNLIWPQITPFDLGIGGENQNWFKSEANGICSKVLWISSESKIKN